jgi:pimeloyl-ACP methyl ester carboxylesterase
MNDSSIISLENNLRLITALFAFTIVLLPAGITPVFADKDQTPTNWSSINLHVLDKPADKMLADYYENLSTVKTQAAVNNIPADRFAANADAVRRQYAKHLMMPVNDPKPVVDFVGTIEVDGIQVEKQLIRTRPGIYSQALVYKPAKTPNSPAKSPTMLMLPGHGDPAWASSVQSRCLSFAKKGYLVLFVEPFGQMERGENFRWNEYHGSMTSAYLLTIGQSLLGCIMADHVSEITYLLSRPDVDPDRLSLGGVSMGGSHTLWLMALDTRIKAATAVSAAPVDQPVWAMRHHCLCDTVWDGFNIVPDDYLRSLCAPRAYMQIFPSTERPASVDNQRRYANGEISFEDMANKYGLTDDEIQHLTPYAREVYKLLGVPDKYTMNVVEGPHDFNAPMRELAAGWFAYSFGDAKSIVPVPEPKIAPMTNKQAMPVLDFWYVHGPPKDALNPVTYLQREVASKIAEISKTPANADSLKKINTKVKSLLKVDISPDKTTSQDTGTVKAGDLNIHKVIVTSEPGIELPLLLIEPANRKSSEAVLIMNPAGKDAVLASGLPEKLARSGKWVAIFEPRGVGETTCIRAVGAYTGVNDIDMGIAALKVGQTLAGQWTKDTLAAIEAINLTAGRKLRITVRGERQCGFVALLAGAFSKSVSSVETVDMLASYYSPKGYGKPYAYANEYGRKVENLNLGGWKSMLPSIPYILDTADIPQIAALVSPKPLTIISPKYADDSNLSKEEISTVFNWTNEAYQSAGRLGKLVIRL